MSGARNPAVRIRTGDGWWRRAVEHQESSWEAAPRVPWARKWGLLGEGRTSLPRSNAREGDSELGLKGQEGARSGDEEEGKRERFRAGSVGSQDPRDPDPDDRARSLYPDAHLGTQVNPKGTGTFSIDLNIPHPLPPAPQRLLTNIFAGHSECPRCLWVCREELPPSPLQFRPTALPGLQNSPFHSRLCTGHGKHTSLWGRRPEQSLR